VANIADAVDIGASGLGTIVTSVAGRTGDVVLAKADVGLGSVNNTADIDKPVSTAQAAADTSVATAAAAALAAHAGAADPHAGYQLKSAKGQPNGYAGVDGDGKIPAGLLPSIAIVEYLGSAASQSAMLALVGQKGDWCVRTDTGMNWIITGNDPTQIGSWTQLTYPASPVTSVAGRTGDVVLAKADVGLGSVDNTPDASKPVSTAQAAADASVAVAAATALSLHVSAADPHSAYQLKTEKGAVNGYAPLGSDQKVPSIHLPPSSGGGSTNLWFTAAEWIPRGTNGCGVNSSEFATHRTNWDELLFDAGAIEYAQIEIVMPSNWDRGPVTARIHWRAASSAGNVRWEVCGRSYANGDALDAARGASQSVTQASGTANTLRITNATPAITLAGTAGLGNLVKFELYRNATAEVGGLPVDAVFLGAEISYSSL
jgi:hypothetical protein